jgi:hypothetical protein
MSNGFIYVVDAHFIDKIEENKYPGPKCLCVGANISYKPITNTAWVRAQLCKLQKGMQTPL